MKDREGELVEVLKARASTTEIRRVVELLSLRREKHRGHLESEENPTARGRAQECKLLIGLLTE